MNVFSFLAVISLLFLVQYVLDSLAIHNGFMEKISLAFSVCACIFCFMSIKPDSLIKSSDDPTFLIGGFAGLLYFGLFRHWVFLIKVRKIKAKRKNKH